MSYMFLIKKKYIFLYFKKELKNLDNLKKFMKKLNIR